MHSKNLSSLAPNKVIAFLYALAINVLIIKILIFFLIEYVISAHTY